jgi:hypothetical protein
MKCRLPKKRKTLKGDDAETGGSCPDGYFIIDVGIGGKADKNLNGFACYNGFDSVIDDILTIESGNIQVLQ